MTREQAEELLELWGQESLFADGFDDAIIGVFESPIGSPSSAVRVVYSIEKSLAILMSRDGMDMEEADEFLTFNVIGAYVGEWTPLYIQTGVYT